MKIFHSISLNVLVGNVAALLFALVLCQSSRAQGTLYCGELRNAPTFDKWALFIPHGTNDAWWLSFELDDMGSSLLRYHFSPYWEGQHVRLWDPHPSEPEPGQWDYDTWRYSLSVSKWEFVPSCDGPITDSATIDTVNNDPILVYPGNKVRVWVRMRNNGTTTWSVGSGYNGQVIGMDIGEDATLKSDVSPGGTLLFSREVIAPQEPGHYYYGIQLLHIGGCLTNARRDATQVSSRCRPTNGS